MSFNAAALQIMFDKGLTLADVIEIATANERRSDPTNADRQARHRAKKVTPLRNALHPLKKDQTPSSVSDETVGKPTDPVKELFDLGVSVLVATGMVEKEARSYVGKLRKERGDGLALAGLTECRTKAISNPVEWLPKWFERQQAASPLSFLDHKLNQERLAGARQ